MKNRITGKYLHAGKDRRQEEKGMTEDEMAYISFVIFNLIYLKILILTKKERIYKLDGITSSMDMSLSKLGDPGGQKSLACRSPWGSRESHTT